MLIGRILSAAAALTMVSACGDTPLALDSSHPEFSVVAAGSAKMVPFVAYHTSELADASSVVCPAGTFPGRSILAGGRARHLGRLTGEASACVSFAGPGMFVSVAAHVTFIGANGDEVRLEMDSANPQVWTVHPGGVVTNVGGFDIVGGTGRFAGATGYVTLSSTRNPGEATSATTQGRISSPGSIN